MKPRFVALLATLTLSFVAGTAFASDRDRDDRRSVYSEGLGGGLRPHTFHRDNGSRDSYGERNDVRGQHYVERRDDREQHRRHRDRDNHDYYRDNHRHYRDYAPYPRHVVVERHYNYPRRVIYYTDDWGHHRYYYVNDSYWEHYYDHVYYHRGRHIHVGCHYHGFFDALATGIVIGAIVGDW
jgi:hypothetical protein